MGSSQNKVIEVMLIIFRIQIQAACAAAWNTVGGQIARHYGIININMVRV